MAGVILADKEPGRGPQRLGVSGLALHYANIINQIDNIVSKPLNFFHHQSHGYDRWFGFSVLGLIQLKYHMLLDFSTLLPTSEYKGQFVSRDAKQC